MKGVSFPVERGEAVDIPSALLRTSIGRIKKEGIAVEGE
jgi:hypothetical protein